MILAIEGASTDLSAAVAADDGSILAEAAWTSAQRQSAELLPRVESLLAAEGLGLGALRAVAVGTGPGSFTGLRVAMALAKGFSVALGRPIVGVPSLVAWLAAEPDADAAVARAGAREAYLLARDAEGPEIVDRDRLAELVAGRPVVAPSELAAAFDLRHARSPKAAGTVARLAAERLAGEPEGDDLRTLEPIYLRAPRGLPADPAGEVRWL